MGQALELDGTSGQGQQSPPLLSCFFSLPLATWPSARHLERDLVRRPSEKSWWRSLYHLRELLSGVSVCSCWPSRDTCNLEWLGRNLGHQVDLPRVLLEEYSWHPFSMDSITND